MEPTRTYKSAKFSRSGPKNTHDFKVNAFCGFGCRVMKRQTLAYTSRCGVHHVQPSYSNSVLGPPSPKAGWDVSDRR